MGKKIGMDYESEYLFFSVAFDPLSENFNNLINIELHKGFSGLSKKLKKARLRLHVDGKQHTKWEIIGIRESYESALALAMSYLKFHFKENPEVLGLPDSVFDNKGSTEIPMPIY